MVSANPAKASMRMSAFAATGAVGRSGARNSESVTMQARSCREPRTLPARIIEVFGREPALKRALAGRPLGIEHGKPGGIAAAPLDDHVLAEDAFERETEPQRGATRGGIERVAFPF